MYSLRLRQSPQWQQVISQLSDPGGLGLHEANINDFDISITTSIQHQSDHAHTESRHNRQKFFMNFSPPPTGKHTSLSAATLALFPRPPTTTLRPATHTLNAILITCHDLAPSKYESTVHQLEAFAYHLSGKSPFVSGIVMFLLSDDVKHPKTAIVAAARLGLPPAKPILRSRHSSALLDVAPQVRRAYVRSPNVQKGISAFANSTDSHASSYKAYIQLQAAVLSHHDDKVKRLKTVTITGPDQVVDVLTKHNEASILAAKVKLHSEAEKASQAEMARNAINTLLPATPIDEHPSGNHALLLTEMYPSVEDFAKSMGDADGHDALGLRVRDHGDRRDDVDADLGCFDNECLCEV